MNITIRNQELILDRNKAIFYPKHNLLIISDIHLGKSAHFRKAGLQIPNVLANNDLKRLAKLLNHYQPKSLLINGDLLHHDLNSEIETFTKWRNNFPNTEFVLVQGNHDKLLASNYKNLGIDLLVDHYQLESFLFIHDQPKDFNNDFYPITGHIHPGVSIIGKAKQRLKFPCFYFGTAYAILPAFSEFTGLKIIYPKENERIFAVTQNRVMEV